VVRKSRRATEEYSAETDPMHVSANTRLDECTDILGPGALVEIHGEKPACLVGEERVDVHDVPTGEMAKYVEAAVEYSGAVSR